MNPSSRSTGRPPEDPLVLELRRLGLDLDAEDDPRGRRRESARVVHAKLRDLHLWPQVASVHSVTPGALNFVAADVDALRRVLRDRPDFRERTGPGERWELRELRARASLHLKHFDGWPPARVHAHVDPRGALLPAAWWCFPPLPLLQLALHALDAKGYQDPARIRRILESQGVAILGG